MANSQAVCTSFKSELLTAEHNFSSHTFKAALILASASLGAATTVYDGTGELAATGNYSTGGATFTWIAPATSGTTAYTTPSASISWTTFTSSGSFDAVQFYNDTHASDASIAIFTFGAQSITAGTFTLTMPTNDASTGLLRIA